MAIHPRRKKFLEELPKHDNVVLNAAKAAGYSDSYARKRGKRLFQTALKDQAKDIVEQLEGKPMSVVDSKKLMSEIVGLTPAIIMERLRFIATQEKDLHTALKVLAVLAQEHGVELESSETRVSVPILNIVVDKPNAEDMALLSPPTDSVVEV